MIIEGFEKLFLVSWMEWDELDMMDIQFYDAILRKDVFVHLLPDLDFDRSYDVAFMGSSSKIQICAGNGECHVFDITGMSFSPTTPA